LILLLRRRLKFAIAGLNDEAGDLLFAIFDRQIEW